MTEASTDTVNPTQPSPPEDLRDLVRQHPGLVVAGGVVLGLIVGALLPRRAGSKFARNAMALAATAGEIGLALSTQAKDRAEDGLRHGRDRLIDLSADTSRAMRQRSGQARDVGLKLADKAAKLAAKTRR